MGDNILYMRGPLPFKPSARITKSLVADAKLVAGLPEDAFGSLLSSLSGFPGFLSRTALEELIAPLFPADDHARRAAKFLLAVDRLQRGQGMKADQVAGEISAWVEARREDPGDVGMDRELLTTLADRLKLLFASVPGLDRQAKARSLPTRVGQPLEQLEMICDLRPVFNESRDEVEGMIPLTTLRLVCIGADGLPVAFDAVLTEQDVFSLATASGDAKKKLKRLRELLSSSGIIIPEIDATKPGKTEEDASDR